MATTFTKIASVSVGAGGAANMEFTSIPSTYTDLCVKYSTRSSSSLKYGTVQIRFNGATTQYSWRSLEGTGSTVYSESVTPTYMIGGQGSGNGATASTFGNGEVYIPNYAGSTNKSMSADGVSENNGTEAYATLVANLWSNTSAITSILLYPDSGTWQQYSTATLYGVSKS